MQLLEQHCGTRLLQRTTRRINLTPDGEAFYRQSKPLLSQADALLESFSTDQVLHGQLRVDMPVAFATLLVVPHLPDFYRQHPGVEIILSSSDRRQDMLRDGLDCLLRVGQLDDGDYIARKLGSIKMTTCASPAYIASHGAPQTLEDLQDHQAINWINSSSRQIMPWTFATPEGITEMTLPGKLVIDNSETYLSAGLAGGGVGLGKEPFFTTLSRPRPFSGSLTRQPLPRPQTVTLVSAPPSLTQSAGVYRVARELIVKDAMRR